MDKKLIGALAFIFGATLGALGTKLQLEKKYQKRMNDGIADVRDYYKKKEEYITYSQPEVAPEVDSEVGTPGDYTAALEKRAALKARAKPEVVNYAAMAKELGYQGEPIPIETKNPAMAPVKPKNMGNTKPFVISYEDYGRKDGQEISSLTYYICGTLAEDDDTVLDPAAVERIVTRELLEANFTSDADEGPGRENSIYIRNNLLGCDYEILRDYRSYFEVVGDNPEDRMD